MLSKVKFSIKKVQKYVNSKEENNEDSYYLLKNAVTSTQTHSLFIFLLFIGWNYLGILFNTNIFSQRSFYL